MIMHKTWDHSQRFFLNLPTTMIHSRKTWEKSLAITIMLLNWLVITLTLNAHLKQCGREIINTILKVFLYFSCIRTRDLRQRKETALPAQPHHSWYRDDILPKNIRIKLWFFDFIWTFLKLWHIRVSHLFKDFKILWYTYCFFNLS